MNSLKSQPIKLVEFYVIIQTFIQIAPTLVQPNTSIFMLLGFFVVVHLFVCIMDTELYCSYFSNLEKCYQRHDRLGQSPHLNHSLHLKPAPYISQHHLQSLGF